ncbi:MAG: V-type ATP synthase subunit F [Lachnospiraceae bacterium]|nr:V-type ATP synthase subunit F [Lachnospiraceae bacterium]MDD4524825.1 V-type ATP synthase subunit F [Lachnospiraceae bacterium]
MSKIAVMGDWDSIYGFSALGLDTFSFDEKNIDDAGRTLRRLSEGDYKVIYVTEALASKIQNEIEHYRTLPSPAIIQIPGISGNTGEGISAVKKSVEQAVGSDIIFGGNS